MKTAASGVQLTYDDFLLFPEPGSLAAPSVR
jgi:hypothetical protein